MMEKITTLERWLTVMAETNPDSRINMKTARLMNDILNGTDKHLVVFDNAGGMPFSIWDFKSEADLKGFMNMDTLNESLIFGYVTGGVSTLSQWQIDHPHWDLPQPPKREIKF